MRKITNGAGIDTTALIQGMIAQGSQFYMPTLFSIMPAAVSPQISLGVATQIPFWITDWETSLFSTFIKSQYTLAGQFDGIFHRSVVKREAITFEVGLQAAQTKVSWAPNRSTLVKIPAGAGADNPAVDLYTQFANGAFDNGAIRIWKGYLNPENVGDLDTYGTMELFLGRISEVAVATDWIDIEVKSYLDMLDGQIPRQTIGPGNRQNNFGLVFTRTASGNPVVQLEAASPYPAGQPLTTYVASGPNGGPPTIYPPHFFAGMTLSLGTQGNYLVRDSDTNGANNFLYLYKPMKTQPAAAANAGYVLQPQPMTQQPTTPGVFGNPIATPGFPYVPRPEDQF